MQRTVLLTLVAAISLAAGCLAQEGMTTEEAAVRNTYSKLLYAHDLATVHGASRATPNLTPQRLQDALHQEALTISLSGFNVGGRGALVGLQYSDIVTKPSGDVLNVAPISLRATTEALEEYENNASVGWVKGQEVLEDWNVPVSKVLESMEGGSGVFSFAAYTVDVSFRGKTRHYKATFFFGKDSGGGLVAYPLDPITGNSALKYFFANDVFPATWISGIERPSGAVLSWLKTTSLSSCKKIGGSCCDPVAMKCGPAPEELDKIRAKPITNNRLRDESALQPVGFLSTTRSRLSNALFSPKPLLPTCEDQG